MQSLKSTLLPAILLTLAFLSAGFLLLHFELIGFGSSFFVFLPFTLGYLFGKRDIKLVSLWGLAIGLVIFLCLLLSSNLEGMVCVLMALPIILVAIALGFLVRYMLQHNRSQKTEKGPENLLKGSLLPFVVFIMFGFFENWWFGSRQASIAVQSQIDLPFSPLTVYDAIKSVDTLIADKPFLMHLDLPVPQKCILEEERVGALRTCYFEGGRIVERITQLEPGKVLRMDVIDYQLTGRKWLGFKEAIYTFDKLPEGGCRMTRITTYTSELYPRFYWEPLEQIGIEQEHQYVFENLKRDLGLLN